MQAILDLHVLIIINFVNLTLLTTNVCPPTHTRRASRAVQKLLRPNESPPVGP